MDQLKKLFAALSWGQRIGIAATLILVAGGMSGLVHWKHEKDFHPLFTGMSAEDAGAIVQKLKESGVEYRIADNGTSVLVPELKVDELRIQLAGAGLPRTGRIGFELFDKTNLGITDFTEHVNYRRALEGELERSIRSLTEVEQARVHVTFPKDSVFLESREAAKASVLISLRQGSHLTPQNVAAVINLVASAVEGLTPESVSVLDMQGNLLNRPRKQSADSELSDLALDYKHQVEKDLTAKVESTLEPLLGVGKFRVGVSADCDFSSSEQSDEIYDPTRSVMVSSQKTEDTSNPAIESGVPGTASNLPRPTSRPASAGASISRKTQNEAYETTRTIKHVKTPQGVLKRLSASLLLDQEVQWQGKTRTVIPPPPEKIKAIHDVVAAVLGIVPGRGDQLVIESLPFEQTLNSEPFSEAPAKPLAKPQTLTELLLSDRKNLIGAGVVVLFLTLVLVLLTRRRPKPVAVTQVAAALPAPAEVENSRRISEPSDNYDPETLQIASSKNLDLLRAQTKEAIAKNPAFAASILRGWLQEESV